MKKIKSIQHLKAEKQLLKREAALMEDKIRNGWAELKKTFRPTNLANEALNKVLYDKTKVNMNGKSFFKKVFVYGISLLATKMADKVGEKIEKLCK